MIALLALALYLYVRRWRRARAEGGARAASGWRLTTFLAGIASVAAALISPIDRLGEQLFVMHMVQHVLLLDIAPILLILGLTKHILRPLTRPLQALEHGRGGVLLSPVFAVAVYVVAMWAWHVPVAYDAALRNPALHILEHICFGVAGALYWWHVLSPVRNRRRLGGMGPVLYMCSTKLLVGFLGVAIAFAPTAIYHYYVLHSHHYWGLSPHDDQAAGGLLMALEQSIVMGIALAALFMRMLSESEREAQRAERYA